MIFKPVSSFLRLIGRLFTFFYEYTDASSSSIIKGDHLRYAGGYSSKMASRAGLIDELVGEHRIILTALDEVNKLGIGSTEGQSKLSSIRDILLEHIRKEDRLLYPLLRDKADNDASLGRTLELFAKDMDMISALCLEFFLKYTNGGSGLEFAKDFGRFYTTMRSRISKEEKIIYPHYHSIQEG